MRLLLQPPATTARGLRIAHVTDTYAPAMNGVVRSVESTAETLRRIGYGVHVFAPGARSHARAEPREGTTWFPAIETNIYPSLHVSVLPILPRHLRDVDVVHVHTPGPLGVGALLSARRASIPAVYTYHTRFDDLLHYISPFQSAERILARVAHKLHGALLRRADAVIAPTPTIARELRDQHGCEAHVVGSGVDLLRFSPSAPRPTSRHAPLILTLGRLSGEKNVEALIRAMPSVREQAPGARLQIAGAGPHRAALERLARGLALGDAVQFLGRVPETDLPRAYQEADVFASASRFETQGLTLLEAMACGTPCAVADVDVFRDLGPSATARFDPDDPRDVARAILAANDARATLRREGLRVARTSSTFASAQRMADVYERVASDA